MGRHSGGTGRFKGCYCETTWNGRASQGRAGMHDATGDAAQGQWLAGAWDRSTNQPCRPRTITTQSPKARHDPGTGVRDAAAWWPPSSCCISSGTLTMSAPALSVSASALSVSAVACWHPPSPCAGGAGLASARGLADGCSEAELLLCARPTGARTEDCVSTTKRTHVNNSDF